MNQIISHINLEVLLFKVNTCILPLIIQTTLIFEKQRFTEGKTSLEVVFLINYS